VILLASCFAVLWGTLFPVISEAVSGEKITVGAPFFNKVNVPIGLVLLFLTGVGPLFAWRRTSTESLKKNFMWPAVASLALGAVLVALGMRHFYAIVCFVLCLFVTITILVEFYRGGRVIQGKQGLTLPGAMIELTHRNTRRYGGYLVHMGVVLMCIGFAGAAFNLTQQAELAVGDTLQLGKYEFRVTELKEDNNANHATAIAAVDVLKNGELLATMHPERRFYHASQQGTSEVAIRPRLNEDVYIVYAGVSNDGSKPILQVYINPLVTWIWIGALTLVFGTLVALVPSKVKRIHPKTRIVGTTRKPHVVLTKS
jgi:cytochrome c-type biogenesis protein CcmF